MNTDDNRNLPARRSEPQKSIVLGNINEIGLEGLSDDVREELLKDYAKGMIEVNALAMKYGVETQALAAALRNMSAETLTATRENTSITMTRTQQDTLGKTEVIVGNTETARKGKLTRSQSGLPDYTLAYIIAGAIVVIVLALLLRR